MGQRLNLEVCYDGEVLANAYYHWSAYTSTSLRMLKKVLDAYKNRTEIAPLKVAVEILQATGAGVDKAEKASIAADTSGGFDGIKFQDAKNRNEGLLAVTKSGIEETRYWEEGRVTVDISTEEFVFDVMWRMSDAEYEDGREPGAASNLPDTKFNFLEPCSFRDYSKFEEAVQNNSDGVRIDDDDILCWIE